MILRDVFNINQHSPADDQKLELHDKIGAYFLHTISLPNIIANTGYSGTGFLAADLHSKCGSFQQKSGQLFQSIYLDPVKGCIGFIIQYADYISCQSFPNKLSAQRRYFQRVLSSQVSDVLQSYRSGFPVCELDKLTEQVNFFMEYDRIFDNTDVSHDGSASETGSTGDDNNAQGPEGLGQHETDVIDEKHVSSEGKSGLKILVEDSSETEKKHVSSTASEIGGKDYFRQELEFEKPSTEESAWRENVVFHPLIHCLPKFLTRNQTSNTC
jgi:hypothetical protein